MKVEAGMCGSHLYPARVPPCGVQGGGGSLVYLCSLVKHSKLTGVCMLGIHCTPGLTYIHSIGMQRKAIHYYDSA